MEIGRKIRAWRDERGYTQNELAEKANISRSYLAGVETGKYNPSLDTLDNIASALGLTSAFLLRDENENSGLVVSIYDDYRTGGLIDEVDEVIMELLDIIQNGTDEDRQDLLDMYRIIKKRRETR